MKPAQDRPILYPLELYKAGAKIRCINKNRVNSNSGYRYGEIYISTGYYFNSASKLWRVDTLLDSNGLEQNGWNVVDFRPVIMETKAGRLLYETR